MFSQYKPKNNNAIQIRPRVEKKITETFKMNEMLTRGGIISRNFKPALSLLNLRVRFRPRKIEKRRGIKLVRPISFQRLLKTLFNEILHFFVHLFLHSKKTKRFFYSTKKSEEIIEV